MKATVHRYKLTVLLPPPSVSKGWEDQESEHDWKSLPRLVLREPSQTHLDAWRIIHSRFSAAQKLLSPCLQDPKRHPDFSSVDYYRETEMAQAGL